MRSATRNQDFVWHEAVDLQRFAWVECLSCGHWSLCEPTADERVHDVCRCGMRITGRLNGWKHYPRLTPRLQRGYDPSQPGGEGDTHGT